MNQIDKDYVLELSRKSSQIMDEVNKVVQGKQETVRLLLCAMISKGHVLIEDIPGVGKTTMALSFARAINLKQNRVQFTPDVMPSDITGFYMYKKATESFELYQGASMCNILLADEINRTSPKTQSALLEVMEEGSVTVEMKTFAVPKPFMVIATQNPLGYTGTQPLPEAQLDRFMMRLKVGYPTRTDEIDIMKLRTRSESADTDDLTTTDMITPVATAQDIINMQKAATSIHVDDSIYNYIIDLTTSTRTHPTIEMGASPRGSIGVLRASKATALMQGRTYVTPADVKAVFYAVMGHRILLKRSSQLRHATEESILASVLSNVRPPSVLH